MWRFGALLGEKGISWAIRIQIANLGEFEGREGCCATSEQEKVSAEKVKAELGRNKGCFKLKYRIKNRVENGAG